LPAGYDAIVTIDGDFVNFQTSEKRVRRRSRMVQRLAILAAHAQLQPAAADIVRL
jgi:hypothetical protein